MSDLEKFKYNSIASQLEKDLPNHAEKDRVKYLDLLTIMVDDHTVLELEVNGGKESFTHFINNYADRLLEWKSKST